MAAYLRTHKTAISQYRSPRRARPTGLVCIHTAESILDTVGPDTGAENVADWLTRRTNYGSYHDLVDSDSAIQLVEYGDEAFHDGTGSNPYSLSISFALRASDWPKLSPTKRAAFLRQAAIAYARQQAWLRAHGHPTTPLRRITRAQSTAGAAGFISHAERDPDRRTDPGEHFPWAEFFDHCRAAISQEDDMNGPQEQLLRDTLTTAKGAAQMATEARNWIVDPTRGILAQLSRLAAAVAADRDDVDDQALAQQVIAGLAPQVAAAAGAQAGLTEDQIRKITEDVVRRVFADAGARPAT